MDPLISIIVPIYNVEKYLEKCIYSLQKQTYTNIEILLIDDGSTDSSGTICENFASADKRIKVIHKENGGVSDARNLGMKKMSGEYFGFVDGDDTVHPDYVKRLFETITAYDSDISMCAYVYKWQDGTTKRTRNDEFPDSHIFHDSGKDALGKMLLSKIYSPSSCSRLFNAKKISFSFPHYAIGEDMLTSVSYLSDAQKVVMTNEPLYYYMQNDDSVMHSVNPEKIFDTVVTGDEMMKLVSKKCPENRAAAEYYIVEKNLMVLMKLYGLKGQEEKTEHIKSNIKKYRKSVILNSDAEMRTRIACMISYLGINTLCKIRNIITK